MKTRSKLHTASKTSSKQSKKSPQNSSDLFIILNKKTNNLLKSTKNEDLVQCALEYNDYLIENLSRERGSLSVEEYDFAVGRLYDNLSLLCKSYDCFNGEKRRKKDGGEELGGSECDREEDGEDVAVEDSRVYSNSKTGLVFRF